MKQITVRHETSEDYKAVRQINELVFEQPGESRLVEGLRNQDIETISLVATIDNQIIGHIFFSPVTIEDSKDDFKAMGLAPMAVLPEFQKQGIGSKLVREGIQASKNARYQLIFVLGHPEYYPRFGFSEAMPLGFQCEYEAPSKAWMVLELEKDALSSNGGLVRFNSEFKKI